MKKKIADWYWLIRKRYWSEISRERAERNLAIRLALLIGYWTGVAFGFNNLPTAIIFGICLIVFGFGITMFDAIRMNSQADEYGLMKDDE